MRRSHMLALCERERPRRSNLGTETPVRDDASLTEGSDRSFSDLERRVLAAVIAVIAAAATAGYWLGEPVAYLTYVVAAPIPALPLLIGWPLHAWLAPVIGETGVIRIVQLLTLAVITGLVFIEVVVTYAVVRAGVRLIRRKRPLI